MGNDDSSDHDGSLPLRFLAGLVKFLFGECSIGISEEDEEKHESVPKLMQARESRCDRGN